MSAVAEELARSRKWSASGASIGFLVSGTEDPGEAITAVIDEAPSEFNGHLLRTPNIDRVIERTTDDIFFISVPYSPPEKSVSDDNSEIGEVTWSTDVGFESIRVKNSLETVASYGPPDPQDPEATLTPPNLGNQINVSGTGVERKVEGVDGQFPVTKLVGTFKAPNLVVTDTFRDNLENLVGTVCDSTFRNKVAGEVRFDGFTDRQVFGQNFGYELTTRFSVRKNVTGLTIGDITGIDKDGWDYLWTYYERDEDGAAKTTILKPRAVYIERIFPRADWSAMGAAFGFSPPGPV